MTVEELQDEVSSDILDQKRLKKTSIYNARWLAKQSPEYFSKRKAAARARDRSRYATDPAYRKRKLNATEKWRVQNPEIAKTKKQAGKLRYRYGLTLELLLQMLEAQKGLCAICEDPIGMEKKDGIKKLHIDHDHSTNQVRALLCGPVIRLWASLKKIRIVCVKPLNTLNVQRV